MEDKPRPNFTSSVSIAVPGPGQDEVDRAAMPNHGHDNPGFDADEAVTISVPEDGANGPLNGSMTSTASTVTADGTPTKTGKEAVAEAVNLELVNMNPFSASEKAAMEEAGSNGAANGANGHGGNGVNGIPIKKDSAEDVRDPYDEYFVPVNEHRKCMR